MFTFMLPKLCDKILNAPNQEDCHTVNIETADWDGGGEMQCETN